jgi:hypothetical protein
MGVVHENDRVVFFGNRDDFRQRSDITIHTKNAVCNDEFSSRSFQLRFSELFF